MNKKKSAVFVIACLAMMLISCGKDDVVSDTSEALEIGGGLSFQESVDESTESADMSNLVLTATDLEGMEETTTTVIKAGSIYPKPSKTASAIGTVGKNDEIAVYGQLEDSEWYVVSYNGRVGYILDACIESEEIETVISTPDRTTTENTGTGSNGTGTTAGNGTGAGSSGTGSNTNSNTGSGTETGTGRGTGNESGSNTETESERGTGNESGSNTETGSGSDTDTESGSGTNTDSEPGTEDEGGSSTEGTTTTPDENNPTDDTGTTEGDNTSTPDVPEPTTETEIPDESDSEEIIGE